MRTALSGSGREQRGENERPAHRRSV